MSEELEFDLILYPEPVLRRVAQPIGVDDEVQAIVAGMFAVMVRSKGVGLAGPQVGLKKRVLVINATGEPEDELALVNPTIVERSGPNVVFEEGCLSFPGIYAEVERREICVVDALDPDGRPIRAEYTGFVSRIIQHEYDHLEGILLVDRMSPADKLRHKAALEELVERYKRSRPAPARKR
ncbi:MAG: peptide deformylase [Planctomycetota bacterium]|nr:peptide deformylase [Planctomycetota bacterium]